MTPTHAAQIDAASHEILATYANYAQIVSAVATLVGLVSIFLLIKQLNDTRDWNKLHFAFSFFPQPTELEQLERDIDTVTRFWRRDDPFTRDEVLALLGSLPVASFASFAPQPTNPKATPDELAAVWFESGRRLKQYLNLIEMYACAVNSGVADSHTAKMIYGFKFKAHFRKAKPYIDEVRDQKKDSSIFCEIERLLQEQWYPPEKPESVRKKY